jgi:hypothetical protein
MKGPTRRRLPFESFTAMADGTQRGDECLGGNARTPWRRTIA